jgi:hypothetical protein
MALETRDLVEIQMLVARYGHILDERDWGSLDQVFTADIVFDATDSGLGVMRGIEAIVELWQEPFDGHPLGHYTTNVYVFEDPDGTVRVRSKHLGPRVGMITLMTYEDVVVKTPAGWRLAERIARIHHRIPMYERP